MFAPGSGNPEISTIEPLITPYCENEIDQTNKIKIALFINNRNITTPPLILFTRNFDEILYQFFALPDLFDLN